MNQRERNAVQTLADDLRWVLHVLLPNVDEEIPCGWMGHEDKNWLTAAEAHRQKVIARFLLPKKDKAK